MQEMTPLELKYHLRDIERSFARCQTPVPTPDGREPAGHGWMGILMNWIRRPSATTLTKMAD